MANEVNGTAPGTPAPAGPAPAAPQPIAPQPAAPAPQPASPAQPVHPPAQPYGVRPAVIHQEKGFYQKVWFWVVLAIGMLVISIIGSVCGTYLYRAMSGTTTPGNFRMMNGGNFGGGGSGSGGMYNNNGSGSGGRGNSGSGSGSGSNSSGSGTVTQ